MLPLLIAVNVLLWAGILVYCLGLTPAFAKRRSGAVMAGLLLTGALASFGSYQAAMQARRKEAIQRYYHAGLDEKQRGNLAEAERHFEEALTLDPGNPQAKQELEGVRKERPTEQREQLKETAVEPAPQSSGPQASSPASGTTPADSPSGNAPETKGSPGEKPKPAAHKPSPFEIEHYALDVTLDPEKHALDATATIVVRSRGERIPVFDFSLNSEFEPDSATVDGKPAALDHTNDLLKVTPRSALNGRAKATVVIHYKRENESPLVAGGDLISLQGTYLRSEARWYPATGELDFRSPVRVTATVPRGFTAVSVGALNSVRTGPMTTTFHWETDRFASMVSLAAAKYVEQSIAAPLPSPGPGQPAGTLPISCFTFPNHKDRAAQFLKEAGAILRFYQKRFGPYPYEKLAIVEIPMFPGGYGTTSFVMLIDKSFEAKKLDREFLAHEIAHQWWGNSVFPQGLGAAWLTEAFSNYSAWEYAAASAGNPRILQKRVAQAMTTYFQQSEARGDQALSETDPYAPVGASEAILYEKGAVVLHMLRHQIGATAFNRTMRRFADEYRFGKAKIEDFRKIAAAESGQDLGWFFDQWLNRTGGMAFSYSFDTQPDTASQNLGLVTVTQPAPGYRGKMKVVMQVDNGAVTREIALTGEPAQTFSFPIEGRLTSVLFDPDGVYLMKPPRWVVTEN